MNKNLRAMLLTGVVPAALAMPAMSSPAADANPQPALRNPSTNLRVPRQSPNIIYILADDLGWGDVGFNQGIVPTPNIDRLAREGVVISQHYVAPVCTPTRASLMTGRYWSRFGVYGVSAGQSLPFDTFTLARAMKAAGYKTAQIGKWHLGSKPEWGPNHFGFDRSYGSLGGGTGPWDHRYKEGAYSHTWHRDGNLITEEGHVTDLLGNEAVNYILENALPSPTRAAEPLSTGATGGPIQNRKSKIENHAGSAPAPFFLYLAFTAMHIPVKEPRQWLDAVPDGLPQKMTARLAALKAARPELFAGKGIKPSNLDIARQYAACIMHLDHEVGRIVAALEKTGARDNTIIVFASDNGAAIGVENNDAAYPGGQDYAPGGIPGSSHPLRGWKTMLFDGGIRTPAFINWPGVLAPRTMTQPACVADWLPTFCALLNAPLPPGKDLKWDGMNLWPHITGEKENIERVIYTATKDRALRAGDWKLIVHGNGADPAQVMLFNMADDPNETRNLAPANPAKVAELRKKLKEVSRNDNDSVVEGMFIPPEQSVKNGKPSKRQKKSGELD